MLESSAKRSFNRIGTFVDTMMYAVASLSRRLPSRFTSPQRLVRSITSTKYNDLEPIERKENILPVRFFSWKEAASSEKKSRFFPAHPCSLVSFLTDTVDRNIRQFVPDLFHDGNYAGVRLGW
jgi:hypothetical protein